MYGNWDFSSPSSSSPCCFAYYYRDFCIFLDFYEYGRLIFNKAYTCQQSDRKKSAHWFSFIWYFSPYYCNIATIFEFPFNIWFGKIVHALASKLYGAKWLEIMLSRHIFRRVLFFLDETMAPPPPGLVLRMDYSSPTYPKFTTIICCGCDGCIKDEILIGRPMFSISTKPKWVVLILYF